MDNRQTLRKTLRARRRALSPYQQQLAAQHLLRLVKRQPLFLRSQHIAFYLPNDGEIDPRPLIQEAWRRGKHCYLPILAPSQSNRLWFVRYTPHTPMVSNRFGIPEPRARFQHRRLPHLLDAVFLPLVGFDRRGGRMGMGGGFYDRSLAGLPGCKPVLVGLAHHCQQVEQLTLAHWDIPLAAIATDQEVIVAQQRQSCDFFQTQDR